MNRLFNAILYYSRIPTPKWVECTPQTLSESLRYFPLVGLIVGTLGFGGYYLASLALPHNIAVIVAMIVMTLSTGALHEDGLADLCDGFGGGYGREAILRIMKDSHIGTYGVIGLIVTLFLRYSLLCEVDSLSMPYVMILAQGASRFGSVAVVRTTSYARVEPSKSSHSALGLSAVGVGVAMLLSIAPLLLLGWQFALIYTLTMALVVALFRGYIVRCIGGFTGDTLGALQQILEIIFYIIFLIWLV
ncbi:MAG: adenosylcobinamide-GDP ribazoletransferase [Rikenellaceae bacterium]